MRVLNDEEIREADTITLEQLESFEVISGGDTEVYSKLIEGELGRSVATRQHQADLRAFIELMGKYGREYSSTWDSPSLSYLVCFPFEVYQSLTQMVKEQE